MGRKISYEKSATAFSVKLGARTTQVIQEFDAFVSNVGVDTNRCSIWQIRGNTSPKYFAHFLRHFWAESELENLNLCVMFCQAYLVDYIDFFFEKYTS